MGFDVNRFISHIDEELICSICTGVLENPAQVPSCEHTFCRECISEWLLGNSNCPADRGRVLVSCLKPVPRIIKNLLAKLEIRCDNVEHGCSEVLRLEFLNDHLATCQFNPKRPVRCETCGLVIPHNELEDHLCVRELRSLYDQSVERISNLEVELSNLRNELAPFMRQTGNSNAANQGNAGGTGTTPAAAGGNQRPRVQLVTAAFAPVPIRLPQYFPNLIARTDQNLNVLSPGGGSPLPNSAVATVPAASTSRQIGSNEVAVAPIPAVTVPPTGQNPINNNNNNNNTTAVSPVNLTPTNQIGISDELLRWINSLMIARVTRWGGMISTPDMVLQGVIRRALVDSGCPLRILNQLMINAHERSWPSGLQNLETRQINRMYYESYICRRIPGRQAVVVMAADNRHMEAEMICEPGLVMIFAHGVQ